LNPKLKLSKYGLKPGEEIELKVKQSGELKKSGSTGEVWQFFKVTIEQPNGAGPISRTLKMDLNKDKLSDVVGAVVKKYRVNNLAEWGLYYNGLLVDPTKALTNFKFEHMQVLVFKMKKVSTN